MATTLADPCTVTAALPPDTLALRGAFHPDARDNVPELATGGPTRTVVLLGWTGGRQWPAFSGSAEASDGQPDPLDRWSRRLIDAAAVTLGATAFYPFGGPPHHDFLHWAMRAEPVTRSPIGLLMHPSSGLWHAYRGALGFPTLLDLVQSDDEPSPCSLCVQRQCLSACPVTAFTPQGYEVGVCKKHLHKTEGIDCLTGGCLARQACPVKPPSPYQAEQNDFHMRAFAQPR
jgi:ferredoxin